LRFGGNERESRADEDPMRRGENIAARLAGLSAAVLDVVKKLPKDIAGRHVAGQLTRAGTAGGANYEEARSAESRADFIHKLGIAAKEVPETIYWLSVVRASGMFDASPVIAEADELLSILVASRKTAHRNLR